MSPSTSLLAFVFTLGCATSTASGQRPSSGLSAAGEATPSSGTLASARPLPAGPPVTFNIGCETSFYVGPFAFQRHGDVARLASTIRSADGSQVCSVTAAWVNGTGEFVSTSGVNCAEGTTPVTAEQTQDYSPDNGGSSANPVFLHVERHDAAGCVLVELTLARR